MNFRRTISIPLQADPKGFVDRECPSEQCLFTFKVHLDDWDKNPSPKYCPQCRHQAPADHWHTQAQLRHAKREAENQLYAEAHKIFKGIARDFNSGQRRNSFLSLSLNVTSPTPRNFILPAPATEALQLDITCDQCNARFAVIGSAFFCPICGHNSAVRMFDGAIAKIRTKVDTLADIRAALTQSGQADQAADMCRSLLESTLPDAVTAFQRFSEELYNGRSPAKPAPTNAFQRLDKGSALWKQELGEGYSDWLTAPELRQLKIYFQQRHLLEHQQGIVDQPYLDRSGDTTYQLGQRIVVSATDALRCTALVEKLAQKLRSFPSSP